MRRSTRPRKLRVWVWGLVLVTGICAPSVSSQTLGDSSLAAVLARAYAMVRAEPASAIPLFEKAADMDPRNASVRLQLGYLYHGRREYVKALAHFLGAESLRSSDTTKLQIAYTLAALGRSEESRAVCRELLGSPVPAVREAAGLQLEASQTGGEPGRWWGRLYLSPYYDTRWETAFFYGSLLQAYAVTDDRRLSTYAFLTVSGDARSEGGLSPVVFSDNTLVAGLGVQYKPFAGLQLSLQQGIAFDLIDRASRSPARGDFRAVGVYGNGLYAAAVRPEHPTLFFNPWADIYASAGYYSRYDDGIAYLQARAGTRTAEWGRMALDVYAKAGVVRDTRKLFYNNIVEGALGVRLFPWTPLGLVLAAEFHRGYYWDVGTTRNPYNPYYSTYRIFLIVDRTFSL